MKGVDVLALFKKEVDRRGLKLTEVADLCQIPYKSVYRLLKGSSPSGVQWDTIVSLCEGLNVSPFYLVDEKRKKENKFPVASEIEKLVKRVILNQFSPNCEDLLGGHFAKDCRIFSPRYTDPESYHWEEMMALNSKHLEIIPDIRYHFFRISMITDKSVSVVYETINWELDMQKKVLQAVILSLQNNKLTPDNKITRYWWDVIYVNHHGEYSPEVED